eukprot:TRINITY_DN111937_c0_g1_i1.p1 TRINITY_DN111937_c0_g1~~TRINITY_DN111937_c0_g1_i1.p1  ORF type:complete len:299 (-),score=43.73 TRINITY_DN111937_c0_g1_i1:259-1101(-)
MSTKQRNPAVHFKRTQMCKFFAQGMCERGSTCTFAHSAKEVRQQPDFSKTRLCQDYMKFDRCDNGLNCKFAHGYKELRKFKRGAQASVTSSMLTGCKNGQATNAAFDRTPSSDTAAGRAAKAENPFVPGAIDIAVPPSAEMPPALHHLALCTPMHQQAPYDQSCDLEPVCSRESSVDRQSPLGVNRLPKGSTSSITDDLEFARTLSTSTTATSADMWPSDTSSSSFAAQPPYALPETKYFQQSCGFWNYHGVTVKNTFFDQVPQRHVQSLRRCSSAPYVC